MFAKQTKGHSLHSANQEITVIITRRTQLRNTNSFRVIITRITQLRNTNSFRVAHNNSEVIICTARPQRMSDMRQCTKMRLSKKQKHQN